jgi:hypothetical protein
MSSSGSQECRQRERSRASTGRARASVKSSLAPAGSASAPAVDRPQIVAVNPPRRRRHTGTRRVRPRLRPPRRAVTSFPCSVGSRLPAAAGRTPHPLPPLPVSVKPEKASPLAPPGLGAAPGDPGRASLTGLAGAAWSCQRPTPQRRSLCDRNPGTMALQPESMPPVCGRRERRMSRDV